MRRTSRGCAVSRLALQGLGDCLEAFDCDTRAAVLVGLDRARRHADRLGELGLREAARLTGFGEASANTPADGAFSLHDATSCGVPKSVPKSDFAAPCCLRNLRLVFGFVGGRTRTRTWDPLIKSQLLYQLSYAPGMPPAGPRKGCVL